MKPLILDFKLPRLEAENPITYNYDPTSSLNVVSVNGLTKPFIDLKFSDIELMTKTRAERERDDDAFLSELGTKTEAHRERDDPSNNLLELETKTLQARERDDQ